MAPGLRIAATALSTPPPARLSDTAVAGWTLGRVTTGGAAGRHRGAQPALLQRGHRQRPDRRTTSTSASWPFDNLNSPCPAPSARRASGPTAARRLHAAPSRTTLATRAFVGQQRAGAWRPTPPATRYAAEWQRFCKYRYLQLRSRGGGRRRCPGHAERHQRPMIAPPQWRHGEAPGAGTRAAAPAMRREDAVRTPTASRSPLTSATARSPSVVYDATAPQ